MTTFGNRKPLKRLDLNFKLLGEVLLRTGLKHAGFVWVDENGIPILKKNEQTKVSPISKVFKRLKNGKEDNIKPFFDIGICIAQQESKFKIK